MRYHANVNVRMRTAKRYDLRRALWQDITPMVKSLPRLAFTVRVIARWDSTMTRKEALDQLMTTGELIDQARRR